MDKRKQKVIAVDFDGTLAEYEAGDYEKYGHQKLGAPVPEMVKKVKAALDSGHDVVVFTARVNTMSATPKDLLAATECYLLIADWCKKNIGTVLPITYEKSGLMDEFWDDKAIGVIPNTGVFATELMDPHES